MRIGVIYVSFGMPEYLTGSLLPWIAARQCRLGGHDWVIACVSVPFVGFEMTTDATTRAALATHLAHRQIDWALTEDTPLLETEARTRALRYLIDAGVTHSWIADGDEFYTEDQIERIAGTVERNPFVAWWKLSFRNYVFDDKTYLVEPFTPPRIHEVHLGAYQAHSFYDDNSILYSGTITRDLKRDVDWAGFTLQSPACMIRHLTWMNSERSRLKCTYQTARGWECSFAWDPARGGLVFNDAYFKARGQTIPEVVTDPS